MTAQRSVLVTGASSGIGRSACLLYARRGAAVLAMARTGDRLRTLVEEIRAAGGRAAFAVGDVGRRADVREAVALAAKEFGGVDTVVANAGFGIYSDVASITEEDFDSIVRTNVKGVLWALQESLPHLRAARGRFGIVSSILGRAAVPYSALYCMTKHALTALADTARLELAKDGISVTVVGPGLTATDFQSNAVSRVGVVAAPDNSVGWPVEKVAARLVSAVERRRREVYLGLAGRSLIWARNRFPRLADWGIRRWMQQFEKTLPKKGG